MGYRTLIGSREFLLSDFNPKNHFEIEKFLPTRFPLRPGERYRSYDVSPEELAEFTR